MVLTRGIIEQNHANGELIPGIPDDITISAILTKLPWSMLPTLAAVGRGWLQALQNGNIYEARVSTNCTETMFVRCDIQAKDTKDKLRFDLQFSLYSVENDSLYYLPSYKTPPLLGVDFDGDYTYTCVNGRLYVISLYMRPSRGTMRGAQLYTHAYDLARHKGWRQCATFKFGSQRHRTPPCLWAPLECGVMNDKILLICHCGLNSISALYDPEADVWSPIINSAHDFLHQPCIISHGDGPHQKLLAGTGIQEDLVYHYGCISDRHGPIEWITNFRINGAHFKVPFFSFPCGARIKSAEQEVNSGRGIAVMLVNGRFLKWTRGHIDAYDSHTNTWTPLNFEGPFEFIDSDSILQGFTTASSTCAVDVTVVRNKHEMFSVTVVEEELGFEWKRCLMKSEIPVPGDKWQKYPSSRQNGVVGQWKELKCKLPVWGRFLRCPVQL